MKSFTGFEYLLIDAANQFGLDKLPFEERIQWAMTNLNHLDEMEALADKKTKPLYIKAVMAIRKAQQGISTGHLVGLDACCSGIQIMSAMTGCIAGAESTGMVNPNERADAYGKLNSVMGAILGSANAVTRQDAKDALMKAFYGSKAEPKRIFGEDTDELNAFYQSAVTIAPGAWELLQDLLASWNPFALEHAWTLPDGFRARVKVMEKKEARIEVDELGHSSFTYEFYENRGTETGLSNVANVTHSMDAWVLRNMHRRCNYNQLVMDYAKNTLDLELLERVLGEPRDTLCLDDKVGYYREQWERSTLADPVILPCLNSENVKCLDRKHIEQLIVIVDSMLAHKPFELVTVHDEFKAHPNNLNHVRQHYIDIMAEIADSNVLDDLLSQVYGTPGHFQKLSKNLGTLIRGSNYALS